ncbi:hypothetical protein BSKO_03599 [Bryopsis sp. KO-2023]|nr:hypothetical protein BSKO_03599 [Bryopsis sp. KO-2023]
MAVAMILPMDRPHRLKLCGFVRDWEELSRHRLKVCVFVRDCEELSRHWSEVVLEDGEELAEGDDGTSALRKVRRVSLNRAYAVDILNRSRALRRCRRRFSLFSDRISCRGSITKKLGKEHRRRVISGNKMGDEE